MEETMTKPTIKSYRPAGAIEEWIKETRDTKFDDQLNFKYFLWDRLKISLRIIEHLMEFDDRWENEKAREVLEKAHKEIES